MFSDNYTVCEFVTMSSLIKPDLEDVEESRTDRRSVSDLNSPWKDAPSSWGHSLHSLSPYVGSFPPELAHYFIRRFTEVGDTVIDPFCGCGTVPLEAGIHNREAVGSDLFSYAYVLSKAKCNPLDHHDLTRFLNQKTEQVESINKSLDDLLSNTDLQVFYSDYTLEKLVKLRKVLVNDGSREANYVKALVSGILHGPSDMFLSLQTKDTYSGTADYVEDYAARNDLTLPERDINPRVIRKHNLAQDDYIPPWLSNRTSIIRADSRDLPFSSPSTNIKKRMADLVLTSPPYMAKLDYTWNNWLRLWWLGEDRKQEQSELVQTQDVNQYKQFMEKSLDQMYKVLKPDGVAVLIVGDVTKRLVDGPRTINTARIIEKIAEEKTDFVPYSMILDDYEIGSRSFVSFNQAKYDHSDEKTQEFAEIDRCLILKKGNPEMNADVEIDWSCEPYK